MSQTGSRVSRLPGQVSLAQNQSSRWPNLSRLYPMAADPTLNLTVADLPVRMGRLVPQRVVLSGASMLAIQVGKS